MRARKRHKGSEVKREKEREREKEKEEREKVRKKGRGRTKRRNEKERKGERHESKDGAISHKKRRKVWGGEASKREGKKGIEKSMRKRGRRGLHFELAFANLAEY